MIKKKVWQNILEISSGLKTIWDHWVLPYTGHATKLIFDTGKSKHVIILVQTHQGQVSIHVILNKNATVEQLGSDECIPCTLETDEPIQTLQFLQHQLCPFAYQKHLY